jgi:hypothetical protein
METRTCEAIMKINRARNLAIDIRDCFVPI